MDDLIEFLLEIVLEGSIELSSNKKVPNWIRYPLIFIISLLFLAVLGVIFFGGFTALEDNVLFGIIMFALGIFILIGGVIKVRRIYNERNKERENKEKNSDQAIKF